MKPFLVFIFAIVMVTTVTAQKRVLVDFRVDRAAKPTKIPVATRKTILAKVFPRYLTDANKCNDKFVAGEENDLLTAARKAGQIVPSISDVVQGSFTSSGRSQTAYVISVSECFASHADNYGSTRIAIFEGRKLVVDLDLDFNSNVLRKTDLDGDGLNELFMSAGYVNQGIVVETSDLLSFKDSKLTVIEDFGQVSEDSCASGLPNSGKTASVISVGMASQGRMPKLQIDNYKSSCRPPSRWRFASTGKQTPA